MHPEICEKRLMSRPNPVQESRAAIVLCGGESRRMGQSKAMLRLGSRTFLETIVETVSTVCDTVIVVAAPGQPLPDLPGHIRAVHDRIAHHGPLTGFATGLAALPGSSAYVFLTGTDTPLLRPSFVAAMFEYAAGRDLAIPFDGVRHHPLSAAYRVDFAIDRSRELLAQDRHKLMSLAESVDSVEVSPDDLRSVDPDLASFRNVNSPEDYRSLLVSLGLKIPDEFR